uniref:DDE Tnp4 domain-containing protein n=1 Tax=Arundo donax TaxID=35708 RepID=A0A0A9F477_ARUDO
MLSTDIIKPRYPEFRMLHPRLQDPWFSPLFDDCIGAIDGMHVPLVVLASKVLQHVGHHGHSTQNVLAICDFDMRLTFVIAGWPGLIHDMRVFNDAICKYGDKFPHPPPSKQTSCHFISLVYLFVKCLLDFFYLISNVF